jgi:hypothetical protein
MKQSQAIQILHRAGIFNPLRLVKLIKKIIGFLDLDLSGLTVLTEAASGPYVVTPVIALLAGAECVLALSGDSHYASAKAVVAQTHALETICGFKDSVEIHTQRSLDLFAQADIVTNLGFVRPIDANAVAAMKPTAVVPLMCETWEFRADDVDLEACQRNRILVLGTNEDYPGLEVFEYTGLLCQKMLFDAQIEVNRSKVTVVSSDNFGRVIEQQLTRSGALVRLTPDLRQVAAQELADSDAIVVADYRRNDFIIGPGGDILAGDLARIAPTVTVLQFSGRVDIRSLEKLGITVYPGRELNSHRMAMTLASLSPRAVIDLHAAGLKVGELGARMLLTGLTTSEACTVLKKEYPLAQVLVATPNNL